jgi:hypothetical protein
MGGLFFACGAAATALGWNRRPQALFGSDLEPRLGRCLTSAMGHLRTLEPG